MKKLIIGFIMAGLLASLTAVPAYAVAYDNAADWEDTRERTDLKIELTAPVGMDEGIELYYGEETFYLYTDPAAGVRKVTIQALPGLKEVGVFMPGDYSGSYSIACPAVHDAAVDDSMQIRISLAETEEDYYDGNDADAYPTMAHSFELYDFSGGKEYGTFRISVPYYAAIESITYTLLGADRVYEVELRKDNLFSAEVRLPAGTYVESSTVKVTPYKEVAADQLSFSFGHKGTASYGRSYHVETGKEIATDDLIVNMRYRNDIREVDDLILLKNVIDRAKAENVNQRREKFRKGR